MWKNSRIDFGAELFFFFFSSFNSSSKWKQLTCISHTKYRYEEQKKSIRNRLSKNRRIGRNQFQCLNIFFGLLWLSCWRNQTGFLYFMYYLSFSCCRWSLSFSLFTVNKSNCTFHRTTHISIENPLYNRTYTRYVSLSLLHTYKRAENVCLLFQFGITEFRSVFGQSGFA